MNEVACQLRCRTRGSGPLKINEKGVSVRGRNKHKGPEAEKKSLISLISYKSYVVTAK